MLAKIFNDVESPCREVPDCHCLHTENFLPQAYMAVIIKHRLYSVYEGFVRALRADHILDKLVVQGGSQIVLRAQVAGDADLVKPFAAFLQRTNMEEKIHLIPLSSAGFISCL